MDEKVARYLADGVRLVWVFDPHTSSVQVHTLNSIHSTRLTEAHTLDGGDVLPGFELEIRAVFAA